MEQVVLNKSEVEVIDVFLQEGHYRNHAEALILRCYQGQRIARHDHNSTLISILQQDPKILDWLFHVFENLVVLSANHNFENDFWLDDLGSEASNSIKLLQGILELLTHPISQGLVVDFLFLNGLVVVVDNRDVKEHFEVVDDLVELIEPQLSHGDHFVKGVD